MAFQKNLTLGRGRLYFDQFLEGTTTKTGERYLGSTNAVSITNTSTELDHYDMEGGIKVIDDSVTLQTDRQGKFTVESINPENIALLFATSPTVRVVAPSSSGTDSFDVTALGLYYQLGETVASPDGVRGVTTVVLKVATVTITPTGNYTVDLALGRINVLDDAVDIDVGDTIDLTYDVTGGDETMIIDETTQVAGALRFIANNARGPNRDYYFPDVILSADGDYQLKGDTWMAMGFNFKAVTRDDLTQRIYVRAG